MCEREREGVCVCERERECVCVCERERDQNIADSCNLLALIFFRAKKKKLYSLVPGSIALVFLTTPNLARVLLAVGGRKIWSIRTALY